jgi:Pyruvate/2-oxoacid:ferredoxin oxidoreductase delta subunit
MIRPVIDYQICQACQPCEARLACKTRAIVKIEPDEPPYIAGERCSGCSACVRACTYSAIVMRQTGSTIVGE